MFRQGMAKAETKRTDRGCCNCLGKRRGAGTTTVAVKMERSEWIYRTYFAGGIPELAAGMGAVREE